MGFNSGFKRLNWFFFCFLRWYSLSDQQYENTGLDDECVGTGNMDVLENELQGERIKRIQKCLHVGADSSVSAMRNTAECPYWDTQLPQCPHWDTAECPY